MANPRKLKRGLPTNVALEPSKQNEFNQKIKNITKKEKPNPKPKKIKYLPGVIYISRLPWGFEEKQLREYFSQFGSIRNLMVSRSFKTGNSRGYAFVQFAHDEVAKVAAESMNNYLMFDKLIKCTHMSRAKPWTFKHADRKIIPYESRNKAIAAHNKPKDGQSVNRIQTRILKKYKKKIQQLTKLGIDYKLEPLETEWDKRQLLKSKLKRENESESKDKVKLEISFDYSDAKLTSPGRPQKRKSSGKATVKASKKSKKEKNDPETVKVAKAVGNKKPETKKKSPLKKKSSQKKKSPLIEEIKEEVMSDDNSQSKDDLQNSLQLKKTHERGQAKQTSPLKSAKRKSLNTGEISSGQKGTRGMKKEKNDPKTVKVSKAVGQKKPQTKKKNPLKKNSPLVKEVKEEVMSDDNSQSKYDQKNSLQLEKTPENGQAKQTGPCKSANRKSLDKGIVNSGKKGARGRKKMINDSDTVKDKEVINLEDIDPLKQTNKTGAKQKRVPVKTAKTAGRSAALKTQKMKLKQKRLKKI